MKIAVAHSNDGPRLCAIVDGYAVDNRAAYRRRRAGR